LLRSENRSMTTLMLRSNSAENPLLRLGPNTQDPAHPPAPGPAAKHPIPKWKRRANRAARRAGL